jgi:hypothetical protein
MKANPKNKKVTKTECNVCGSYIRYLSNNKCVKCMYKSGTRRAERKKHLSPLQRTGIPEGFIKFGTVAYRILTTLHKFGPMSIAMLHEEIGYESDSINAVSTTLTRLKRHNFVKIIGTDRLPGKRSHSIYLLKHMRTPHGFESTPPVSKAERTRQYRARKKVVVNNVFNFAGFGTRVVKDKPAKKQEPQQIGLNWKRKEVA